MSTPQPPIHALGALQAAVRSGALAAAVQRREHGTALDTAARALQAHEAATDALERLAHGAPAIRSCLDADDQQLLRHKQSTLREIGKTLSGEVETETLERAPEHLAKVAELTRDVHGLLQRGWRTRVDRAFAGFIQLAGVANQLFARDGLGVEMKETANRAAALTRRFPPDDEALAAFDDCVRRRDAALDRLAAAGSGVKDFLLDVARGQATLADLDANTLAWLAEQGVAQHFKIRL